jgi:hypothetical protein
MVFQFTYMANSAQAPDVIVKFISRAQLENDGALIQPQLDAELRRQHARGLFTGEKGQKEAIATLGLYEGSSVLAVGYSGGVAADELRDIGASVAKSTRSEGAAAAVAAPRNGRLPAGAGGAIAC